MRDRCGFLPFASPSRRDCVGGNSAAAKILPTVCHRCDFSLWVSFPNPWCWMCTVITSTTSPTPWRSSRRHACPSPPFWSFWRWASLLFVSFAFVVTINDFRHKHLWSTKQFTSNTCMYMKLLDSDIHDLFQKKLSPNICGVPKFISIVEYCRNTLHAT